MKKLQKLQINSERLMNNEELVRLRGGYEGCGCLCFIGSSPQGYTAASSQPECSNMCVDCGCEYGIVQCF
jgi:natural product precursor